MNDKRTIKRVEVRTWFSRYAYVPLAIQFNGTMLFYFIGNNLGWTPNTVVTAIFHGLLVSWYLIGGASQWNPRAVHVRLADVAFGTVFFVAFASFLFFSWSNPGARALLAYIPFLALAPYVGARLLPVHQLYAFVRLAIHLGLFSMALGVVLSLFGGDEAEARFMIADNPLRDASAVAMALLGVVSLTAAPTERGVRALAVFVAVLFVGLASYYLLMTASRGPLLGISFAMLLLVVLARKGLRARAALMAIVVSAFLALGFFALADATGLYFDPGRIVAGIEVAQGYQPANATHDLSTSMRLVLWLSAADLIAEHPLAGVGMGNFSSHVQLGDAERPLWVHNTILEAWLELGIAGLSLYMLFLGSVVRAAARVVRDACRRIVPAEALFLALAVVYWIVQTQLNGSIYMDLGLYTSAGALIAVSVRSGPARSRPGMSAAP